MDEEGGRGRWVRGWVRRVVVGLSIEWVGGPVGGWVRVDERSRGREHRVGGWVSEEVGEEGEELICQGDSSGPSGWLVRN